MLFLLQRTCNKKFPLATKIVKNRLFAAVAWPAKVALKAAEVA
jgi:hypothetical protein